MRSIKVENFSSKYKVRSITEMDIDEVMKLCLTNSRYYELCPPMVSSETIDRDMKALPPNKKMEDKYYVGYYDGDSLIAVLDFVDGFPTEDSAFLGFFMLRGDLKGKGLGKEIIEDLESYLSELNFKEIRLGYVDGNAEGERFWTGLNYLKTGVVADNESEFYRVVMLQKSL